MSSAVIVVLTTVAGEQEAARVASVLVEERLAACVNRVAVASSYRWQGEVEHGDEVLLIIKATSERRAALEQRITELSSYELPEFLLLTAAASDAYRDWISASCSRPR